VAPTNSDAVTSEVTSRSAPNAGQRPSDSIGETTSDSTKLFVALLLLLLLLPGVWCAAAAAAAAADDGA
jgi:hypothetical protein